jgi:predicted transcriptional regulator
MAALNDFKKYIKAESKALQEYKDMLKVAYDEGITDFYNASKLTIEYIHGPGKKEAADYTEINKLRGWFSNLNKEER